MECSLPYHAPANIFYRYILTRHVLMDWYKLKRVIIRTIALKNSALCCTPQHAFIAVLQYFSFMTDGMHSGVKNEELM